MHGLDWFDPFDAEVGKIFQALFMKRLTVSHVVFALERKIAVKYVRWRMPSLSPSDGYGGLTTTRRRKGGMVLLHFSIMHSMRFFVCVVGTSRRDPVLAKKPPMVSIDYLAMHAQTHDHAHRPHHGAEDPIKGDGHGDGREEEEEEGHMNQIVGEESHADDTDDQRERHDTGRDKEEDEPHGKELIHRHEEDRYEIPGTMRITVERFFYYTCPCS